MFTFNCPTHGTKVLVWPSDIDGVVNGADGIGMVFHCSCGFRGMLVEHRDRGEVVVPLHDDVALTA
jgi:hypothetical protein